MCEAVPTVHCKGLHVEKQSSLKHGVYVTLFYLRPMGGCGVRSPPVECPFEANGKWHEHDLSDQHGANGSLMRTAVSL